MARSQFNSASRSCWRGRTVSTAVVFGAAAIAILGSAAPTAEAGNPTERMYWCDPGSSTIDRADLNGLNQQTILPGVHAVGVAVDAAGGKVYFTEQSPPRIGRANLDGSNVETLIGDADLVDPEDLELDFAAGKLYWTESTGGRIARADLDGSNIETMYGFGAIAPKGLALDLVNQQMYFVDVTGPSIFRLEMVMNGEGGMILDSSAVMDPYDIEVDSEANSIYWSEPGPSSILRADLDGANVEWVFVANAIAPAGLALDREREQIYFTDNRTYRIIRIDYDYTEFDSLVGSLVDPAFIDLELASESEDCLLLEVENLVAGEQARWIVSQGSPGAVAAVVWGTGGPPSVFNGQFGFCASFDFRVSKQQQVVRFGRFNQNGAFQIVREIPEGLSGFAIRFQAAQQSTCPDECVSNLMDVVIG